MSAMPIGAPGWPDLAFCTASIESARSVGAAAANDKCVIHSGLPCCLQHLTNLVFKLQLIGGKQPNAFRQFLHRHRILMMLPEKLSAHRRRSGFADVTA